VSSNGNLLNSELRQLPGFLPYAAGYNFRAVTHADLSDMILAAVYTDAVNMAQDFEAAMHQPLTYAEAYRTFGTQQQRALEHTRGGPTAATPGYSNHGWGIALDYRNGIGGGPGNSTYNWMRTNAGKYGFVEDVPGEHWHWHHPSSTSITKPRTTSTASTGEETLLTLTKKAQDMVIYIQTNAASTDKRYGKLIKGRNFVVDPQARTITSIPNIEAVVAKAAGATIVGVSGDNVWQLANNGLARKRW
jgi:hypothetical protein